MNVDQGSYYQGRPQQKNPRLHGPQILTDKETEDIKAHFIEPKQYHVVLEDAEGETGKFGGFRVPEREQGFGEIGGDEFCRDGHDGVFESAEGFVVEFDVIRVWVAAEAFEPRRRARVFLDRDGCDVVRLHRWEVARML